MASKITSKMFSLLLTLQTFFMHWSRYFYSSVFPIAEIKVLASDQKPISVTWKYYESKLVLFIISIFKYMINILTNFFNLLVKVMNRYNTTLLDYSGPFQVKTNNMEEGNFTKILMSDQKLYFETDQMDSDKDSDDEIVIKPIFLSFKLMNNETEKTYDLKELLFQYRDDYMIYDNKLIYILLFNEYPITGTVSVRYSMMGKFITKEFPLEKIIDLHISQMDKINNIS